MKHNRFSDFNETRASKGFRGFFVMDNPNIEMIAMLLFMAIWSIDTILLEVIL